MDKPVTIFIEDGYFAVQQGNRRAERLEWGEMIDQVIHLTHAAIEKPRYRMLTEAERKLDWARSELRRAELAVEQERSGQGPDELSIFTNGAI
ncbi:hypothetical protein [Labrys neptuniae]